MRRSLSLLAGLVLSTGAFALSLADLSQQDASSGIKDALSQGAQSAVRQLGKPGGFSNDPDMRIGLPGKLGKVARTMKAMGMGKEVEQVEAGMNQAAEAATPQTKPLLLEAVRKLAVTDAKAILSGPQDAATRYLERSSREQLRTRLLPIVKQETDRLGLAQKYNALASQAASFGAIKAKSANLERYVTEQTLDGLFQAIAQEEAKIRKSPAEATSSLTKKVFGAR